MTVAYTRTEPTPRQQRGRELAKARFSEIRRLKARTWSVPSEKGGHAYLVTTNPDTCSCPDSIWRDPGSESCKHVEAVRFVKAVSSECVNCGERRRFRDMIEVPEDSSSLTCFMGDLLCRECFDGSDVAL